MHQPTRSFCAPCARWTDAASMRHARACAMHGRRGGALEAGLSPLWEGLWRASAASIDRADFPRGGTQPPRPADCSSGALDGPPSHLPELAGATPDASGHRGRVPAAAIEIGALRTHWLRAWASTMGRGCVLVGGGGAARPPLVRHLGVPPLGATDQGLPAIGASPLGCIDQRLMAISAFCG